MRGQVSPCRRKPAWARGRTRQRRSQKLQARQVRTRRLVVFGVVRVVLLVAAVVGLVLMYQYAFPDEPVDVGQRGGVQVGSSQQVDLAGQVTSLTRTASWDGDSLEVTLEDGVDEVGLALSGGWGREGDWEQSQVELTDKGQCWHPIRELVVLDSSSSELTYGRVVRLNTPACVSSDSFTLTWAPTRGWSGPIHYAAFEELEIAVKYDSVERMPSPTGFMMTFLDHGVPGGGPYQSRFDDGGDYSGSWLVRNVDACSYPPESNGPQAGRSTCISDAFPSSSPAYTPSPRASVVGVDPNATPAPPPVRNYLRAGSSGGSIDWERVEYQSTREAVLVAMGVLLGFVAAGIYAELDRDGRWLTRRGAGQSPRSRQPRYSKSSRT